MRFTLSHGVGVLFATLTLLVAVPDKSLAGETGIDGVISLSPARPGPLHKGEVAEAPVPNMTFVVKKGTEKVTTFTTDGKGHFHVTLPPGHYLVAREAPQAGIGHWQFEVDVAAGQVASVHWIADSGMR